MAGKFLSIEEVAQQLGVTVDEVHRLVDRKKLFPMRDGAAVKFKTDDVTRLAASLADESVTDASDSIQLDLEGSDAAGSGPRTGSIAGAAASGLELAEEGWALGEPDDGDANGSRTMLGSAAVAPRSDDEESVSLFDEGGGSDDLLLESVVSASSPSLPGLDDLAIDEQIERTVELPGAAGPAASGLSDASAIGSALSGPLESGLSLEDGDVKGSGIDLEIGSGIGGSNVAGGPGGSGLDLGGGSGIGVGSGLGGVSGLGSGSGIAAASGIGGISGIGGQGSLVGEAFDLGAVGDDDSAVSGSVVVATESTGDSSFFGGMDDSASVSFDESASSSFDASALGTAGDFDYAIETPFNAWQIVGLVCCSLVLLFAGLVMFDLAWTIRAPAGTPFSAPLIRSLAQTFGWQ